jgi:hypothetical protein
MITITITIMNERSLRLFLLPLLALLLFLPTLRASAAPQRPSLIVVSGAAGEEEFGENFARWTRLWQANGERAGARVQVIGLATNAAVDDRTLLQRALAAESTNGAVELWVVLLGHGTYDGKAAKFNLRGPDVSSAELADWLKPVRRPVAIINAASASAPFINQLSASNRVIVTATRSGAEINYARFGGYLSEAMADPAADLDKDGQTSLLEAYLIASRRTADFYVTEGRMLTEHALLDDNGDGFGTPADFFRGVRATKSAKAGAPLDGLRAHQWHLLRSEAEQKLTPGVRARRDALELGIARLRQRKPSLAEDEYYQQLEALLVKLARLYQQP